jgi:hypothetical protein
MRPSSGIATEWMLAREIANARLRMGVARNRSVGHLSRGWRRFVSFRPGGNASAAGPETWYRSDQIVRANRLPWEYESDQDRRF